MFRRRGPKFCHPNFLEFVLPGLLPDEGSKAKMVVGRERNKTEWLRDVIEGAEQLSSAKDGAAIGEKHQLNPRSFNQRLGDRKQPSRGGNYPDQRANALTAGKTQHCRSISFKVSARHAPRHKRLGEAGHESEISITPGWLLTKDYKSAGVVWLRVGYSAPLFSL